MGENTDIRNSKKAWREWLSKNGFATIIGLLVALVTFLTSHVFNTITELQDQMFEVRAKLDNQSERELKAMWGILRSYEDKVSEHEIQIRLHDRLIGSGGVSRVEGEGIDVEELMRAIREIMEEDDSYDYREEEMMQQQMQEQYEWENSGK